MVADARLATVLESAVVVALPLRRRFRGLDVRKAVLLQGPSGWGEFAPFDDYSDAAAARWLDCAVEAAWGTWPRSRRASIPVNAIIPALPSEDAAAFTRTTLWDTGCSVVKVKVGDGDLAADEARVAAVRSALDERGGGAIRVDANGAWSVDKAQQAIRVLSRYGLEYVEQPCRTAEEIGALRRRIDVPLAVDESIRTADDPTAVRVSEVADIAIVKAAPLGGVAATLRIAESVGVPVVVSGSLDSAVGLDAAVAVAAALPDLALACGLGTGGLLAADVVDRPRRPADGLLAVQRTVPDPDALAGAVSRVDEVTRDRWRARLARAWGAGSAERVGALVAP